MMSAGFAVVLADKAAVFVDGRYTLQAAAQIDGEAFEIASLIDNPPSTWLAANVQAGARIAYDPWLHPKAEVERFAAALMQPQGELIAMAGNLIDQVWDDQPAAPRAAIRVHDDALAGEGHIAKRGRLGEGLKGAEIDATVLTLPDSISTLESYEGMRVSLVSDNPDAPLPVIETSIQPTGCGPGRASSGTSA